MSITKAVLGLAVLGALFPAAARPSCVAPPRSANPGVVRSTAPLASASSDVISQNTEVDSSRVMHPGWNFALNGTLTGSFVARERVTLARDGGTYTGTRAAPPEVRKTVDAFAGHWTLTGTDMEPGAKTPVSVRAIVDCKPAALGAAVTCLIEADISDTHVEAAAVIGYSPDEHLVRWMEISSTGEYHDHRGPWKDNEIQFEPLTYAVSGAKMTELFIPSFPSSGKMVWKWRVETIEGTSRIELAGMKGSTKPAGQLGG